MNAVVIKIERPEATINPRVELTIAVGAKRYIVTRYDDGLTLVKGTYAGRRRYKEVREMPASKLRTKLIDVATAAVNKGA